MSRYFLLVGLLVATSIVGCDSVGLVEPIGEPLSVEEKNAYVGRWVNGEAEVCELRVAKDGNLILGAMQWDDQKQQFVAVKMLLDARRVGQATYFLIRGEDGKGDYGFLRVERFSDSELQVFGGDPTKFRAAVESGKLKGEVIIKRDERRKTENFQVRLKPDAESIQEVFGADDFSPWMSKHGALVYRRLK